MTFSRRVFLGGLAGGAGALLGSKKQAAARDRFAGYPGRMGLLHDTTLCVGCRSCEAACNEVNLLPAPVVPFSDQGVFKAERRTTDRSLTVVNQYHPAGGQQPIYRKHQCMHCNEPCCASVCFVKAFVKTPEGPVLYDPDICLGCRYCVLACPYYALSFEFDNPTSPEVKRCTMCYPRIKKGLQPGCAAACPMGAIQFGRREDLLTVARQRISKYPDRYLDHIFGEHEYGGTSWLILAGVPFASLGLPAETSTEPLPELTSGFLSVAPLVVTLFPGLLLGFYSFTKRKASLSQSDRAPVEQAQSGQSATLPSSENEGT